MIPSRPLSLVEIIRETVSIYKQIFSRYLLLFFLLCVPGVLLVTYGASNLIETVVSEAHHDIDFSDNDLTAVRDQIRAWLFIHNPMLLQEEQMLQQVDTASSKAVSHDTVAQSNVMSSKPGDSRQIIYYARTNIAHFALPIAMLLCGVILLLLGTIGLTGSLTDLACQIFEEHTPNLPEVLKDNYTRYVWKILLLYTLYMAATTGVDQVFLAVQGYSPQIADVLGPILTVAQIYFFMRLLFTVPALISEELGPFAALGRSWRLTARSGLGILGRVIGFGLILSAVGMLMFLLSGLIVSGTLFPWAEEFLQRSHLSVSWLLESMPNFIRAIAVYFGIPFLVLFSFLPIFTTVFYYDLRTRREGPLVYLEE